MKHEAAVVGQRCVGLFDRLHDAGFDGADELGLGVAAVRVNRAGGMMRVRGVDQQMGRLDAARFLDLFGRAIDHRAGDDR